MTQVRFPGMPKAKPTPVTKLTAQAWAPSPAMRQAIERTAAARAVPSHVTPLPDSYEGSVMQAADRREIAEAAARQEALIARARKR